VGRISVGAEWVLPWFDCSDCTLEALQADPPEPVADFAAAAADV
jgi:hypothetical protein